MRKLLLASVLVASLIAVSVPAAAEVGISIGIALPPLITFAAPPEVIVIPDTDDVYVIPDLDVDIFFWNGWWWRPWEGRWYRSRYYDRGWVYYRNVPSFYYDVDPRWRGYYRDHDWYGHRWQYERIPNRRLQRNWRNWHDSRRWERRETWGVRDYRPRPMPQRRELRRERQTEYQSRPEVQRHRREVERQGRPPAQGRPGRDYGPPGRERQQPRHYQPQGQRPDREQPPGSRRLEPQGRQYQGERRDQGSHGRPEKRDEERR